MKPISKYCPECGEARLYWQPFYINGGQAQNGRISLSEVRCDMILSCDYCSETVKVITDEQACIMLDMLLMDDE